MRILITGAGGFVGRALTRRVATAWPAASLTLFDAVATDAPAGRAIVGDLTNREDRRRAISDGVDILFHLAAVPGGAAEANYALSRAVNVDATLSLFEDVAASADRPRIVYTSTIAVLGDPLPPEVDDATPPRPSMTYGAHKLMMEIALADLSRKGLAEGVAVRLPGIVARPAGAAGMKSAFLSDVFHALRAGRDFVSPVSAEATMWLMSVGRCVDNLLNAAGVAPEALPTSRAMTLPAIRVTMAELIAAIGEGARGEGGGADGARAAPAVTYQPDAALERAFGAYPPLTTVVAEAAGFRNDGDIASLVDRVLADLA